jgi:hypothetical protein
MADVRIHAADPALTYRLQLDWIITLYKALTDHTSIVLFGPQGLPRLIALADTKQWSRLRSTIYRLSLPHLIFDLQSTWQGELVSGFWFLAYSGWWVWTIALLEVAFGPHTTVGQPAPNPWWFYLYLVLIILGALLSPIMYYHAARFLFEKQLPLKKRLFWCLAVFAFAVYILTVVRAEYPGSFAAALSHPGPAIVFTITILVFVLPISIYTVGAIRPTGMFVLWLANFALGGFVVAHNPFAEERLRRILSEPVSWQHGSFMIADVSLHELRVIHAWASQNLAATEKRIAPSLWFFALLAIVTSSATFDTQIQPLLTYLSTRYAEFHARASIFAISPQTAFIFLVALPVVALLMLFVLAAFYRLFRNLVVQAVLVEACTAGMFAIEERFEAELDRAIVRARP